MQKASGSRDPVAIADGCAIVCQICDLKAVAEEAVRKGKEEGQGELGKVKPRRRPEKAWEEQLTQEREEEKRRWKIEGDHREERQKAEKEQTRQEEAGLAEARKEAEAERVYAKMKEMIRTRDEIAERTLQQAVIPPNTRPSLQRARSVVDMTNSEREDEVRRFAMEIYQPIREGQNAEGGKQSETKRVCERRVRAAVALWTATGDFRHVVREEEAIDPETKRRAIEKEKERKERRDKEKSGRQRQTVATAFRMKGQRENSRVAPYPVSEARKEMLVIGKTKLEYHTRAVVREMESSNDSRDSKRILERGITNIMSKIIALGGQQGDDELRDLWPEWDRGL